MAKRKTTPKAQQPPREPVEQDETNSRIADAEPPDEGSDDLPNQPVGQRELSEDEKQAKINAKRFKDPKRDRIVAKHRNLREDTNAAFREENPEEADLQEEVAGIPSLAERMEAEAQGKDWRQVRKQQRQAAADDAGDEGDDSSADDQGEDDPPPEDDQRGEEGVDDARKTYRIRVYGRDTREVPQDEVIRAGLAALQKRDAADRILEEAATREAQLVEWQREVEAWANERVQDGTRTATGGAPNPQPPTPGVASAEAKALARQHAAAVGAGDDEKAAEIMLQIIAANQKAVEQLNPTQPGSRQGSKPMPEPPKPRARTAAQPWSTDDLDRINTVFEKDYSDLLDDPVTYGAARELMAERLKDPNYIGTDPDDLVKDVATTVQRRMAGQSAAPAKRGTPANARQQIESRKTLKAQIPMTPPAAAGRAPGRQGAPERKIPTRSEYVSQLARRTGSNKSRM